MIGIFSDKRDLEYLFDHCLSLSSDDCLIKHVSDR